MVSMAKTSYSKLKFLNLVTMHGNNENCMKIDFDANKEGSNKDIGFWKTIKDNCGVHGKKIL